MSNLTYRPDIDALRGLAVLLVVIHHAFPEILPGGFIGVDVFFVISGYLITTIILKDIHEKRFYFADFYSRRIRRLFPALATVLGFSLILGWLVLLPDELKQLGNHVFRGTLFILNFQFINEIGYFDVESYYKPLLHLWTLSIEEQYYLLWPVVIYFLIKLNIRPGYVFATVFIVSLGASIYFTPDYTNESYLHTGTRFWQLAAGSLAAVYLIEKKTTSNKFIYFFGIFVILISAFTLSQDTLYPGYFAILPVTGAVMIVFSGLKLKTYIGLRQIGLISYPLYLWHWVLLSFTYIYLGRKPEIIWIIGISVLFSYLTYKYIEKVRYKKSTLFLITIVFIIGVAGRFFYKTDGLPDRAQIQYLNKLSHQFVRTDAKDTECIDYVSKKLNEDNLFYYCRSHKLDNTKLLAIIGDSHAHVLFPGFVEIANKYGYGVLLLANSSCPPLDGFLWGRNTQEISKCQISIRQIIKILELENKINKVIISTRGPVYIHGEVDGIFTEQSVLESLKKIENEKLTYDTYFSSFQKTNNSLSEINHLQDIFYLLENPELDFLPKDVLPRPFDFFSISHNRNYMDKNLYLKRMETYREKLLDFRGQMKLLDPKDYLCPESYCISYKHNQFLYADDDHFSVYGSEEIARYFEKEIFHEFIKYE